MGNLKGQGNECFHVTTLLGMPCPALQFGHLKKLNKKGTHIKFLEYACQSHLFLLTKSSGKGFFSNKLLTQGMSAPNFLWKRLSGSLLLGDKSKSCFSCGAKQDTGSGAPW